MYLHSTVSAFLQLFPTLQKKKRNHLKNSNIDEVGIWGKTIILKLLVQENRTFQYGTSEFLYNHLRMTEAVSWRCSVQKVFLKISQNS